MDRLRRDLGEAQFSAQYLQEPVPPGGSMFQRQWLRRYDRPPAPQPGDEVLQSWDTASKTATTNDWSVCVTLLRRGGEFFVLDVFRDRLDYPALKQAAIRQVRHHDPRLVLIEDCGVGTALTAELRKAGFKVRAVKAHSTKEARAAVQADKFEGELVLLPAKAPWLSDFEAELLAFPGGRHDDQVDALCQALAYQRQLVTTRVFLAEDGCVQPLIGK